MAKSSTSFRPGNSAGGRPRLTDIERQARDLRQQCQPELVEFFLGVIRDPAAEMRDRIASAKALLEEGPKQVAISASDDGRLEVVIRHAPQGGEK